jgi:hypothetical protein
MRKKKSKVRFVESRFGQKVRSTFPIAQYRIVSPFQSVAPLLFVYKKQIQISFILSKAYINNRHKL